MANPVTITQLNTFLPEGKCYLWRPDILWLNVGSSTVIALANVLIFSGLIYLMRKSRTGLPHRDVITLFSAMILCSILSQLADILTTWLPFYLFEGWIKAVTASVALTTGLVFISKLPDLFSTHSARSELESARKEIANLETQLNQINSVYQAALGREERIVQLKQEVNTELLYQGKTPRYKIYSGSQ